MRGNGIPQFQLENIDSHELRLLVYTNYTQANIKYLMDYDLG